MTAAAEALDARVDRCPTCDGWRFDGACHAPACQVVVDVDPIEALVERLAS